MQRRDSKVGNKLTFNAANEKSKEAKRNLQNYTLEIFWFMLFTLILFGIFAERAYRKYLKNNLY